MVIFVPVGPFLTPLMRFANELECVRACGGFVCFIERTPGLKIPRLIATPVLKTCPARRSSGILVPVLARDIEVLFAQLKLHRWRRYVRALRRMLMGGYDGRLFS